MFQEQYGTGIDIDRAKEFIINKNLPSSIIKYPISIR